jgi:hypothetical protein
VALPGMQKFDKFGTLSRKLLHATRQSARKAEPQRRTRKLLPFRYRPFAHLAGPRLLGLQQTALPAKGCLLTLVRKEQQSRCRRIG